MKLDEKDMLLMRASRLLALLTLPPGTKIARSLELWRTDYADYLKRKQQGAHQLDLWNNGPQL